MQTQQIEDLIQTQIPDATVSVTTEDGHHFQAVVRSESFSGMTLVERQRKVYQALNEYITTGKLHALQLKTLLPTE